MRSKRIIRSTIGAGLGIALSAGIASAVWSASGSGSGGGAAAVAQGLTVTAFTPTGSAASIYPGGPAGSAYFQVGNPNPYAVTITGATYGTPTSLSSACANSNVTLGTPPTTFSVPVPANSTSTTISVPNAISLAHSAPDGCQGVGFSLPLTITGVQQ